MIDYKSLCQKYPDDSDIADFLAYAQDELRKSRSEDKVELVSDLDKFRAAIASGRLSCISQYVNLFLISFSI